jgi:hypothetical protein
MRRRPARKSREPRKAKKARKRLLGRRTSSTWQEQLDREKQAARDADMRAIAEGRMTVEEVDRRNGLFPGHLFEIDWDEAIRISEEM